MISLKGKIIPEVISGNPELKTNYLVATAICIILSIIVTAVPVYTYSVFLSSYPTEWIPYWMIAQSLTILIIGNLMALYNPTNLKKYMMWLAALSAGVYVILCLIPQKDWYWYAFIEVIIIKLISNYLAIMLWSYITTLFYRNQYKALLANINITFTLGCIISSAGWAAISHSLNISTIIYLLIIAIIASYFILRESTQIVTQKNDDKKTKKTSSDNPLKYPLLQYLFAISFVIIFIYYFTNFLYLRELSIHLDKQAIAVYTSYFLMAANTLNILTNYSLPKAFKKINFSLLLFTILSIIIICNISYALSSGLWQTLFLFLILSSVKDSFLGYLRDYLNSLYPPSIIVKNNFYLKSIVNSFGNIFSALAAVYLFKLANITTIIALICIFLALLGLIISPLIFKKYLNVLKQCISKSSFSMLSPGKEELKAIQGLIASELSNNNINLMQFGLINPKVFPEVPSPLYSIINSNADDNTKIAVIKILQQYSTNKLDLNKLLAAYKKPHLLSDKSANLICQLIMKTNESEQINEIRERLEQTKKITANLLIFNLKHGCASEYSKSIQKTIDLTRSNSPEDRKTAAITLGEIGAGVFYDLKIKLLSDSNQMVRSAMFANLPANDIYYLLPNMDNLTRNNVSILHHKLTKDEQVLIAERLMELFIKHQSKYSITAVNFITTIRDGRVENFIQELLKQNDNYTRTVLAHKIIRRKNKIPLTKNLQQSLQSAIEFEIKLIKEYKKLLKLQDIKKLHTLIYNRLYYARKRVISWYACTHKEHREIINAIEKLNPFEINQETHEVKDKAVEFLLAREKDLNLKKLLEIALTDNSANTSKKTSRKHNFKTITNLDLWLTQIINKYLAKGSEDMNLIQKTIALQQTDFFKSLPDEVLYEIAKACKIEEYASNETIITENEVGDNLYIILDGKVNAYKHDCLLGSLEPYQCFGEISLLANTPTTSSIITEDMTTLLAIDKQDFLSITDDFPQILRTIIDVVIKRFSSQIEAIKNKDDDKAIESSNF